MALSIFILLVAIVLLGVLAVRFFVMLRTALHSGKVEGLLAGRRDYSRAEEPVMFWVNIGACFAGAALGAIALMWAILIAVMSISAYFGQATL